MKRIVAMPWYGGKSKGAIFDFIPKLLEYNNTYCEPFSGAATILLNRPCSIREILKTVYCNRLPQRHSLSLF